MNTVINYKIKKKLVYLNPHGLKFIYGIIVESNNKDLFTLDLFNTEIALETYVFNNPNNYNMPIKDLLNIACRNIKEIIVDLDGSNNFVLKDKRIKTGKILRRKDNISIAKAIGLNLILENLN